MGEGSSGGEIGRRIEMFTELEPRPTHEADIPTTRHSK